MKETNYESLISSVHAIVEENINLKQEVRNLKRLLNNTSSTIESPKDRNKADKLGKDLIALFDRIGKDLLNSTKKESDFLNGTIPLADGTIPEEILNTPIDTFNISMKTFKILENNKMTTLRDIVRRHVKGTLPKELLGSKCGKELGKYLLSQFDLFIRF